MALTFLRRVGWEADVPKNVVRIIVCPRMVLWISDLGRQPYNYSVLEPRSEEPYLEFHCSPWLRKTTLIKNQRVSQIRNCDGAIKIAESPLVPYSKEPLQS